MKSEIIIGNCLDVLPTLPEKSVQCVVTSPPYYGLRDYGCDGQIGLEATPEAYVEKLVAVFREVRRVLRDDGTVFLNLGDSYFGSNQTGGTNSKEGSAKRLGRMFSKAVNVQHEAACGIGDKEPEDYRDRDCLCESLCDACRKAYLIGKSHNGSLPAPMQSLSPSLPIHERKESQNGHFPTLDSSNPEGRNVTAIPDSANLQDHEGEPLLSFQGSTPCLSAPPLQGECLQTDTLSVCPLCGQTSTPCARGCGCRQDCTYGTDSPVGASGRSMLDKSYSYLAYPNLTTPSRNVKLNLKPKDLIGIPWRVAFALQADGWCLRQDIIWCLSGGTWLYARTQKGDMPMMVRDMARLDPATVQLWNGEKWTQALGWSKSARKGNEIEIVLRSGERISCTPTHRFPTTKGLKEASALRSGDILLSRKLPAPDSPLVNVLDDDAAWFAGLYIAEGSRHGEKISIAGHVKEVGRWNRVKQIAEKFGGTATLHEYGNKQVIRVNGTIVNAILDELVTGRTAKDKGLAPICWRHDDTFLRSLLFGYLGGDGHNDIKNNRWRLGFMRNYNLERDIRTMCARLGYQLTLNLASVLYEGKQRPTFRGEIRMEASKHLNAKPRTEVMEIRKSRCREVYDIGVKDEPHLFSLASGILTHNSKPNPMPESVNDRCTKAHEYIFLLTKSARYYYDAEAVKENATKPPDKRESVYKYEGKDPKYATKQGIIAARCKDYREIGRNRRSVWTITTKPFKEAHFATFPPEIPMTCIKAGSKIGDTVLDPFSGAGTVGMVCEKLDRNFIGIELNPSYVKMAEKRVDDVRLPILDYIRQG